jgi:hypothetical protein
MSTPSPYAFEGVPHLTDVIVYAKPRNKGHLEKVQLSCTLQFEDIIQRLLEKGTP